MAKHVEDKKNSERGVTEIFASNATQTERVRVKDRHKDRQKERERGTEIKRQRKSCWQVRARERVSEGTLNVISVVITQPLGTLSFIEIVGSVDWERRIIIR